MTDEILKYEAEKFPVDVDFSSGLADGETIVAGSSSVTAYDGDEVQTSLIVNGSVAAGSGRLYATIQNGEKGKTYIVEFKAVSSLTNVFIHKIPLRIIDIQEG